MRDVNLSNQHKIRVIRESCVFSIAENTSKINKNTKKHQTIENKR